MKFKKKILKNGLRIITVPMKDNKTVTVLVLVEAGSKYENKKNNGISHFLEHMCFKGTTNRPKAGDMSKELDGLGAETNAFTSHEFTGYYAKAHSDQIKKLTEIISDMYLNPIFETNEINKEKGVIIEEMNMLKDLPMRDVQYLIMELMYGKQPAGMTIVGDKHFIKKANRKDFLEYRKKHYVASATTVVVAGNFDEQEVIKDIERKFKNISIGKKEKKLKIKEKQIKPEVLVKNKKSDQTHLVIGVRAFDLLSKEAVITSVIAGILGKGMSSRLFIKLREEMGVCYYVRSGNDTFTDHGFLEISAGVDNSKILLVIKAVLEEFERLKKEFVSKEELVKIKEYLSGNLFLNLESSDSYGEFYGLQELLKKKIDLPEEKAKKIKMVTSDEIKKVANKIFKNNKLNLAIIGPVDFKTQKEIKKIFSLNL